MQTRILFLTNTYFYQPTVDALQRIAPDCETLVKVYHSFDEIPQLYLQWEHWCDAVMLYGTTSRHLLELAFPNSQKIIAAYQVDSDALHRDILRFSIEQPNPDFTRIAVDFLVPLGGGCTVVDFLQQDDMELFIKKNETLAETVSATPGLSLESLILDSIVSLWNRKEIDMVLCLYSSIVPDLIELGIPFRCPFISDGHLNRLIRDVRTRVELRQLHENHPAVIQIFPRNPSVVSADQMDQLHTAISQYFQSNLIEIVTQKTAVSCYAISTLQVIRFITRDFQVCEISAHLSQILDFSVNAAYGVGTSVPHAMNNVQIASKESALLNQPFLVDSNGTLIGPLGSEKRMVIPADSMPDVSNIAKKCSLSAMTVQKLISMVQSTGSDKVTIQELSQHLGTTIRNANRIMLNLCKGGVAKPVYTQTSHSRGRPIQVYVLNFGMNIS